MVTLITTIVCVLMHDISIELHISNYVVKRNAMHTFFSKLHFIQCKFVLPCVIKFGPMLVLLYKCKLIHIGVVSCSEAL